MAIRRAALEVNSGDVHRSLGGYPGADHRMPLCCEVMYAEQRADDETIDYTTSVVRSCGCSSGPPGLKLNLSLPGPDRVNNLSKAHS